jgi:integration host factor subunit alpha
MSIATPFTNFNRLTLRDKTVALTKATIIGKIAEKNNCTPKQAKKTLEDMLEIIKETLESGEDVMVSGFGKFEVREKTPRKGRNPATGKAMILRKRKVVTFKCAGKLKNKINSLMS